MTNEELIKIREEKKLTKGAFAKLVGISPMMQGRYESGKVVIPEKLEEKVKEIAQTVETASAPVAEKKRKSIKTEDLKKVADAVVEKVKETATEVKKTTPKKKAAKKPALSIQSLLGGSITTEEIIERVQKVAPDAEEIYVKTEENKAYYTAKSGDGFIILWE